MVKYTNCTMLTTEYTASVKQMNVCKCVCMSGRKIEKFGTNNGTSTTYISKRERIRTSVVGAEIVVSYNF